MTGSHDVCCVTTFAVAVTLSDFVFRSSFSECRRRRRRLVPSAKRELAVSMMPSVPVLRVPYFNSKSQSDHWWSIILLLQNGGAPPCCQISER